MARKGLFARILFFGGIFVIVTKYVYLIIPAIIALILGVIIRKRRSDRGIGDRVIYIRKR